MPATGRQKEMRRRVMLVLLGAGFLATPILGFLAAMGIGLYTLIKILTNSGHVFRDLVILICAALAYLAVWYFAITFHTVAQDMTQAVLLVFVVSLAGLAAFFLMDCWED